MFVLVCSKDQARCRLPTAAKLRPEHRLLEKTKVFLDVKGGKLHILVRLIIGLDPGKDALQSAAKFLCLLLAALVHGSLLHESCDKTLHWLVPSVH